MFLASLLRRACAWLFFRKAYHHLVSLFGRHRRVGAGSAVAAPCESKPGEEQQQKQEEDDETVEEGPPLPCGFHVALQDYKSYLRNSSRPELFEGWRKEMEKAQQEKSEGKEQVDDNLDEWRPRTEEEIKLCETRVVQALEVLEELKSWVYAFHVQRKEEQQQRQRCRVAVRGSGRSFTDLMSEEVTGLVASYMHMPELQSLLVCNKTLWDSRFAVVSALCGKGGGPRCSELAKYKRLTAMDVHWPWNPECGFTPGPLMKQLGVRFSHGIDDEDEYGLIFRVLAEGSCPDLEIFKLMRIRWDEDYDDGSFTRVSLKPVGEAAEAKPQLFSKLQSFGLDSICLNVGKDEDEDARLEEASDCPLADLAHILRASSSLTDLHLTFLRGCGPGAYWRPLYGLAEPLKTVGPRLRRLVLGGALDSEGDVDALLDVLPHLRALTELGLRNSPALIDRGHMESLVWALVNSGVSFRLKWLQLFWRSCSDAGMGMLAEVMRLGLLPALEELAIEVETPFWSYKDEFLEETRISAAGFDKLIKGVACCRRLKRLCLEGLFRHNHRPWPKDCAKPINPTTTPGDLVKLLPQLTRLRLNGFGGWGNWMYGLGLMFFRKATVLEELSFGGPDLDNTVLAGPLASAVSGMASLRRLSVGYSPLLTDPEALGHFLGAVAAHCKHLQSIDISMLRNMKAGPGAWRGLGRAMAEQKLPYLELIKVTHCGSKFVGPLLEGLGAEAILGCRALRRVQLWDVEDETGEECVTLMEELQIMKFMADLVKKGLSQPAKGSQSPFEALKIYVPMSFWKKRCGANKYGRRVDVFEDMLKGLRRWTQVLSEEEGGDNTPSCDDST